MSYYGVGDYYRGAGDPGFFSSIVKGIGGAVKGFVTGGPVGAITGAASAVFGGSKQQSLPVASPSALPGPVLSFGGTQIAPMAALPGGAPLVSQSAANKPAGYHLNKSRYWTQSRGVVEPGTVWVKNRSRNPTNVKALRRSIRREAAFIKIARRTGLVQVPRSKIVRKRARR